MSSECPVIFNGKKKGTARNCEGKIQAHMFEAVVREVTVQIINERTIAARRRIMQRWSVFRNWSFGYRSFDYIYIYVASRRDDEKITFGARKGASSKETSPSRALRFAQFCTLSPRHDRTVMTRPMRGGTRSVDVCSATLDNALNRTRITLRTIDRLLF